MKNFVGRGLVFIGTRLWQSGGWTGDERYEDLTVMGKAGYHIFCTGLRLMGYEPENIGELIESRLEDMGNVLV